MSIVLKANVANGVAVISVLNNNTMIRVVGASCACSVINGCHDGVNSLTLSPKKGEEAVVALVQKVKYSKEDGMISGHLIGLKWDGDKLFVDTDKQFSPTRDKLGQVVPDRLNGGSLLVTTAGQVFYYTFGTFASDHEKEFLNQGGRTVKDPGLLCRYLVGQATLEELQTSASGDLRSAEQIRISELQSELDRVINQSLAELRRMQLQIDEEVMERRRIQVLLEREHDSNEVLRSEVQRALRERNEAWKKLDKTVGARMQRFWAHVRFICRPKLNFGQ